MESSFVATEHEEQNEEEEEEEEVIQKMRKDGILIPHSHLSQWFCVDPKKLNPMQKSHSQTEDILNEQLPLEIFNFVSPDVGVDVDEVFDHVLASLRS